MIGDLISAGAKLIGGWFDNSEAENLNERKFYQAELDRQAQRDFAQQGIRWRVEDARSAGIHPLYALGANTTSYSPVSVGELAAPSFGASMASAGQDLGRAIDATRTSKEREDATTKAATQLALEKGSLENEMLRTQIRRLQGQVGPPLPSLADANDIPGQRATKKKDDRVYTLPGGHKLVTNTAESQQDDISKEYGDEGLPQMPGQFRFVRDAVNLANRLIANFVIDERTKRGTRQHSRQYYQR